MLLLFVFNFCDQFRAVKFLLKTLMSWIFYCDWKHSCVWWFSSLHQVLARLKTIIRLTILFQGSVLWDFSPLIVLKSLWDVCSLAQCAPPLRPELTQECVFSRGHKRIQDAKKIKNFVLITETEIFLSDKRAGKKVFNLTFR
jgi:hypothetical protein